MSECLGLLLVCLCVYLLRLFLKNSFPRFRAFKFFRTKFISVLKSQLLKSQNLKKAFYNFRLFPIADSCAVLWFVKGFIKGQGLARMIVRRCNGRKLDGPWFTFCKECFDAMYHIIKLLHFLFYRQHVRCIYCVFLLYVTR